MKMVLFLVCLLANIAFAENDLSKVIFDEAFYEKPFKDIEIFKSDRYDVVSADKEFLYSEPSFTLSNLTLGETIVSVEEGKVCQIKISLYNRGDDGRIRNEEFLQKLRDISKTLNLVTKSVGVKNNKRSDPSRTTYDLGGMLWKSHGVEINMEYSVETIGARTVPTPEFIRLNIHKAQAHKQTKMVSTNKVKVVPKNNVKRSANGDVEIENIPMVDQGDKGYCAAATVARLMDYYGYEELDQHQIAMWANSDPNAGTSIPEMMKGISRVLHDKYKLTLRTIYMLDSKEMMRMIDKYNNIARRRKKPVIDIYSLALMSYSDIMERYDIGIVREVLVPNEQAERNWLNRIRTMLDAGIPIVWSVQLGIVREGDLSQSRGGHMRLIQGYNTKEKCIIYSDSWGDAHKRKKMKIEDAMLITTRLLAILPNLN